MQRFDRMLDLPGGPVRVRVTGEGPPLLFSHGVFFSIDVDDESTLGRILGGALGFTVVRWDPRGHGLTPPRAEAGDHRWDALGADVLAVADALGFDRFAAAGTSMGAAVTLHAAVRDPSRISAMLLFALPTAWETRRAEQQRYRDLLAFGSPEAVAARVQDDLDALFPAGDMPAYLRAMVAELRRSTWAALERVIVGASLSDMPDREALSALSIPTLLRPWPGDAGHPLSTARALVAAMPGVDFALLERFDDEAGLRRSFAALLALCSGLA